MTQPAGVSHDGRLWAGQSATQLNRRLRSWRRGLWAAALFSVLINTLMLTVPLYLMQISDRVLSSRSADTLIMLTVVALGAIATLGALDTARRFLLTRIGLSFESRIGAPVLQASINVAAEGARADSQAMRDVQQVRNFLTGPYVPLLFDLPVAPLYLAVVALIHIDLGAITLAGTLGLLIVAVANQVITASAHDRSAGHAMSAFAQAHAQARNADSVRAMGMQPETVSIWGRDAVQAMRLQKKASDRNAILTGLSKTIRLSLQIAVLGWGAWLTLQGELTGAMAIAASIIASRALQPVEGAIEGWRSLVGTRQSFARIRRLLAHAGVTPQRMALPDPQGAVSAENVSYVPAGAAAPILKGISFDVPQGACIAIIGPSGSGKSTLARLLVGATEPTAGAIRLDGSEYRNWDPVQRGSHFGYLAQDVELFPGTIAENIARFRSDAPASAIVEAAERAGAHALITHFAAGYDTELQSGGMPLSGGQRQRVGLARAFFGSPKVIVLDEPDANLDRDGEAALAAALIAEKKAGTTVILVTQRTTLLRLTEQVIVLRAGQIERIGSAASVLGLAGSESKEGSAGAVARQIETIRERLGVEARPGPPAFQTAQTSEEENS